MNFPRFTIISATLQLLLGWTAFAQTPGNETPGQQPAVPVASVTPNPASDEKNMGFRGEAKALARSGNAKAAEKVLTDQNRFKANTHAWHMESARRVIELTGEIVGEGKPELASALADSALQHLRRAGELATNNKTRALAKLGSAYLHEKYKGDVVAAIADYQAALELDPTDAGARESLERLKNAEATLRARIQSAKR